jgi:hypothetical protein
MAFDREALQRRLDALSGNRRKKSATWRPTEGEDSTIRLLSFPDNDGQPFKELWFYYNIGNNPGLLAPYQFGDPDPIQELITKLRGDDARESYELAKKLYPKMRVYAPIIVRGEEEKGVQIWGFGKMVYQSLLNIMLDEDYGDITDPLEGRDVKVTCTREAGRKWATTTVRPRGKETALSTNKSHASEWMSDIPDPTKMYECKSYDELTKIINDWLNSDTDDDSMGTSMGGTSKTTSGDTGSSSSSDSSGYKSLDDAFADLME